MTRQALVLSDCEFSECGEKPYALLTANPTKEHRFIAQTEQRQHSHNPQVSPQDQNVCRLPLLVFHTGEKNHGKEQNRSEATSANTIGNLTAKNPYTLTFVEDSANQYSLESWLNRHESGYEEAYNHLHTLPEGRLKTTTANADTIKVPDALWRILRLKFLGILRNPHNHKNLFAHHLHQTLRARLPGVGFEFVRLISKRSPKRIETIMQDYRFTFLGYVDWLGGLYGMSSEGMVQSSLFERLFRNIFAEPEAVRIELFRYPESTRLCLFGDSSSYLQVSAKLLSIGVSISHDMLAIVHLQTGRQHAFKNISHHDAPKLQGQVRIIDGDQIQRLLFNRLCIQQAYKAVFGQSPNIKDYLEAV